MILNYRWFEADFFLFLIKNYKSGNINWVGDPAEIDMLYQNTINGVKLALASSTETVLSELNKLQYVTTSTMSR